MSKVHRLQEREEANKVGGLLWPEGMVTCAGGGAFCKRRWSTYPGGGTHLWSPSSSGQQSRGSTLIKVGAHLC